MKQKLFSILLMGACFLASVSLFTSCKDYDDDIAANKNEIAALRAQLTEVKSSLETDFNQQKSTYETQISALKAQLQSAIDNKADSETVNALKTQLEKMQQDYEAKMSVLETQISAAADAISRLDQKADKSTVDGVIADLAALTGKLEDEAKAREAVEANLKIQMEALQDFMNKFNDANLQAQIDELKAAIGEIQTNQEVSVMKVQMTELQQLIANVNVNLDALNVLVERMLTSIALVPELYVGGIEAIEFKSLKYTPVKPGTSGLTNDNSPAILISNGTTEATYRLNPTTVQRDGINEANIDFVAARAETRGADILASSPVTFNGIKDFSNGLMTVYLKKNTTGSLNDAGNGKIYIVSLKVPRNAEKYEAADIYSEHSRLVETTITPRIASLPWNTNGYRSGNIDRPHHYSDSAAVYASNVDASPTLALVAQEVYYKENFNLNTIVTGCFDRSTNTHNQITKSELKTYGITFRYAIPTPEYRKDVPNSTNQQEFATVTPDGIISSRTPAGLTDNAAVVGKEPIVRVMMVDTVRNKLVDERYLKIKWIEESITPPSAIQLADKNSEDVLRCGNSSADFKWREFVNEIYAKAENMQGLSQSRFKEIYGDTPTITIENWTTNWNPTSDTSAPASGKISPATGQEYAKPVWQSTTNEHGDALIGTWTLTPEDIYTVYCNKQSDTKTFHAKVYFKAQDKRYADLWFMWNFTIKLPTLPTVAGYYEQYWLDNRVGEAHDVVPVQYNSPLHRASGLTYCVYNNNLMNAFTFYPNKGNGFIVKGVPECGTWDLQFRYNQTVTTSAPDAGTYKPAYDAPGAEAWKSGGLWSNYVSDDFALFEGYKLNWKHSSPVREDLALYMNWDAGHSSWCGNPAHQEANLYADHNTPANQPLLNPLLDTDITGSDGTKQPGRSHDKPVNMVLWATLNNYNYIPLLDYKVYLVAPLRINVAESLGKVQDGVSSGSDVDLRAQFSITDFRGYLVKDANPTPGAPEQQAYPRQLWNYYEVQNPTYDFDQIRYAFDEVTNPDGTKSVKVNNSLPIANCKTADWLFDKTNGGLHPSWDTSRLPIASFFQNGSSYLETMVYAYVPVNVKYGFGSLTKWMRIEIYPHGAIN